MSAVITEEAVSPLAHRVEELCRLGSISRSSVYKAFADGDLTPIKWGRMTLVLDSEFRQLLNRKRDEATEQRAALSTQMSKVRRHQKARPVRDSGRVKAAA